MCIWRHKLCNAKTGVGPTFTWSNEPLSMLLPSAVALAMGLPSAMALVIAIALTVALALDIALADAIIIDIVYILLFGSGFESVFCFVYGYGNNYG